MPEYDPRIRTRQISLLTAVSLFFAQSGIHGINKKPAIPDRLALQSVSIHDRKDIVLFQFHFPVQEFLNVEGVALIKIGRVFVVRVLGQIIFIGQKWPDTAQLKDALAAVQYGKLIDGSEIMTGLLIICAV